MKLSSLLPSAAALGLLAAAVFAATTAVQATQEQPAPQAAPGSTAPQARHSRVARRCAIFPRQPT